MSNFPSITSSSSFFIVIAICMGAVASSVSATRRDWSSYDVMDHLSTTEEIIRMGGYGEEKLSTVLITGTLLCTSCLSPHLQPLPVSGALVAATCNSNSFYNARNKKPTWEKAVTDDNGEFIIDLPSHLHATPNLHKACSIKVLWSPKDSPCQSALIRAKDRVNKIVLSSVGNGIRAYTAGTIQFHQKDSKDPKACKKMAMEVAQDMSW